MKSVVDFADQIKAYAAAGKTIAPVENGTTAVGSYAVGERFIREGVLYKAKTAITAGDTLTLNTNYELAEDLDTQLSNVKQALSNEVEARAKLGAHNLLPVTLANIKRLNTTGTWNDNVYVLNGVTFTVNTDSDGNVTDIKATGTATAEAELKVYGSSTSSSANIVFDSSIIASIGVAGSTSSVRGVVWGTSSSYIDATEVTFNAMTLYGFAIRVLNGYAVPSGGVVFKPMLRLASDTDPTYQPYAMTNKELTEARVKVTTATATTTNGIAEFSFDSSNVYVIGVTSRTHYIGGVRIDVSNSKVLCRAVEWNGSAVADNTSVTVEICYVTK